MSSSLQMKRPDDRFSSIFIPRDHTVPTPYATPTIGAFSSPAQPFGGFQKDVETKAYQGWDDIISGAAIFTRYNAVVVRCLALPDAFDEQTKKYFASNVSEEFVDALQHLLESSLWRHKIKEWHFGNVSIHFNRFVKPKLDQWRESVVCRQARREISLKVLSNIVDLLVEAQNLYLQITQSDIIRQSKQVTRCGSDMRNNVHDIFCFELNHSRNQHNRFNILLQYCLGCMMDPEFSSSNSRPQSCFGDIECTCKTGFDTKLLAQIASVGLGGTNGRSALELAFDNFCANRLVNKWCFAVDWATRKSVVPKLRLWLLRELIPNAQRAMDAISKTLGHRSTAFPDIDKEKIVNSAIRSIGHSRVNQIFNYVRAWPASEGAILDIKECFNLISGVALDKRVLCKRVSDQINGRLLHAGASTTEILGIYVNVIHVMSVLDPRGVMLEKVALPMRLYIRGRADAPDVIAKSFLAKLDHQGNAIAEEGDGAWVCSDITRELAYSTLQAQAARGRLDWDDMDWEPDPIDAGPDFKAARSSDVIAHIFNLFDHDDDLIAAITRVFGTHLRHTIDTELLNETKFVELLKSRLDNSKLQNIEVMLKDIRESIVLNRRANPHQHKLGFLHEPDAKEIQFAIPAEGITLQGLYSRFKSRMGLSKFAATVELVSQKQNNLYFPKRTRLSPEFRMQQHESAPPVNDDEGNALDQEMLFDVKVLSAQFWPQKLEEPGAFSSEIDIVAADDVVTRKQNYASLFAQLSGQRKLQWLPDQDTLDVDLELQDRTLRCKGVLAWMYRVLNHFNNAPDSAGAIPCHVPLSLGEVADSLQMEPDLVYAAVLFWLDRDALYQVSAMSYTILERKADLDPGEVRGDGDHDGDDSDGSRVENGSTIMMLDHNINLADLQFRKQVPMIESFIRNMLGASGARNLTGITMMLSMMLPGFTYSEAEVGTVLEEMRARGETAVADEMWRMAE